ncbi:nuclear transport factor 2 family protein [Sphingopyxis panaciterrulae]
MKKLNFQLERKYNSPMREEETFIYTLIVDLEVSRYNAMLSKDYKVLNNILSDDMHYMHSNATSDSKDEYITKISSGQLRYLSINASNVDIQVCGDHALVLGHLRAEVVSDGKPRILDCKFIAVWSFEGETWRFKAFAPTPIPTVT